MEWAFRGPATLKRPPRRPLDAAAIAAMDPEDAGGRVLRQKPALHRYPGGDGAAGPTSCACSWSTTTTATPAPSGATSAPATSSTGGCASCPATARRRPRSSWPSWPSGWASGRPAGRRRPPRSRDATPRSVADIDSPEALAQGARVQEGEEGAGQGQGRLSRSHRTVPAEPAQASAGHAELAAWLRWRSSQPSSTATARGSWRSWWPAPSMMRRSASPWASASTRASNTGTDSSSEPCTHEQRPRAQPGRGGDGPDLPQLARPRVERRGERRRADDADVPGVQQQPPGMAGPVVEVGRRAQGGHAPHLGVVGGRADGQRAAGAEAGHPHGVDAVEVVQVGRRRRARSSSQPPRRSCPRSRRSRGR